jgi:hypothetical protein
MQSKYLIIREMKDIFSEHVLVLQNKSPIDALFRQKIIGVPFWAQGQEYRVTHTGMYSGVLLLYIVKRGGVAKGSERPTLPARVTI